MLPVLRDNPMWTPAWSGPINRLETLLDRFFGEDSPIGQAWGGLPVAMWQDDDHVNIEADLPGVAEKDVDVTVQNGMLFIRGERKPEEGREYLYNSRPYGRFERVITLPESVNTDDVQARLTNGVLHIALPKSLEARPKKITLKTD